MSEKFQRDMKETQVSELSDHINKLVVDPDVEQFAFIYYTKDRKIGAVCNTEWLVASAMATFLNQHAVRLMFDKRKAAGAEWDTPIEE